MKILIAVDGSECGDVAVEEVAKRPWPADSAARVCHSGIPNPITDSPSRFSFTSSSE